MQSPSSRLVAAPLPLLVIVLNVCKAPRRWEPVGVLSVAGVDAGMGTNSALLNSTQQPARGSRQARSPPGKPLLAPSQLCSRWCPLGARVADGCHLCGSCLGVSRVQSPPWARRRSKKALRAMLAFLLSHPWAQPGHKGDGRAGVGGSPTLSQGLREVMGRRLLCAPGGPGQPSLGPGQVMCPGLCMGLVRP